VQALSSSPARGGRTRRVPAKIIELLGQWRFHVQTCAFSVCTEASERYFVHVNQTIISENMMIVSFTKLGSNFVIRCYGNFQSDVGMGLSWVSHGIFSF
jgi:hypothetical protein